MRLLPEPLVPDGRTHVLWRGRRWIYFGGCDYFRMASHPATCRAAAEATRAFGLSVGASRVTTGNLPILVELEQTLARCLGAPRALLTASGALANLSLAESLAGRFTHVLIDERAHPTLRDAISRMHARVWAFSHRDAGAVRARVGRLPSEARCLLATDGMFPLDGALAPLAEYRKCLPRGATLWVDDCHAVGTLGATGAGSAEFWRLPSRHLIRTATLSKALGSFGGVILGTARDVDGVVRRSATFASTTPPPPAAAAAALKALHLLEADSGFRDRLRARVRDVRAACVAAGLAVADADLSLGQSPIVGIVPRSRAESEQMRRRLVAAGIFPSLIRYPGGPPDGLFRFGLSSEHSREQIRTLMDALTGAGTTHRRR
jgi:7-keto-8-aminopelargonate synthetase-like enzyme